MAKYSLQQDVSLTTLNGFGDVNVGDLVVEQYNVEQLRDAIANDPDPTTMEVLLTEVRLRQLVPMEWGDQSVIDYMLSDETPPRLVNGIWVEDIIREVSHCLSYQEISSYLRGDITLPPRVDPGTIIPSLRNMLQASIGSVVRHWSDIELINFATFTQRPIKTMRNVYRNSPVRELKTADQWMITELMDWLEGYIVSTMMADDTQLLEECRVRWSLPKDWNREEIRDWIISNTKPPLTSNGLWVNSEVRLEKSVVEWTTREIVAFARGEITVLPETHKPLMQEIRARYYYPLKMTEEEILSDIRTKGHDIDQNSSTALVGATTTFIDAFIAANGDGRLQAMAHMAFAKELSRCMSLPEPMFQDTWRQILDTAATSEAEVFNDVTIFGGFSGTTMTASNRASYSSALVLIINTMYPENRSDFAAVLRMINGIRWNGSTNNLRKYYRV